MISSSPVARARFIDILREAGRSTPMMFANRAALSCRAVFFLSIMIGLPSATRAAALEESAKELAAKIAPAVSSGESVDYEIRNTSSLQSEQVSRIDQALREELRGRGVHFGDKGSSETRVIVTLSENWKEFVWTGEIRRSDGARAVLLSVPRGGEAHSVSNAMHVTIRSEKFWEGQERILDAAESYNGSGKSWLVLLLPSAIWIQDLQSGTSSALDIPLGQAVNREPWGKLGEAKTGSTIWFGTGSKLCKVDLETRTPPECLPKDQLDRPISGQYPLMIEGAPAGPAPAGKGTELEIEPVCGGTNQFLATSAHDYTQTDSAQVFEIEPSGTTAMSAELDFPGPILALHSTPDGPRAIVRNLSTGNYEAYRLAISCGE